MMRFFARLIFTLCLLSIGLPASAQRPDAPTYAQRGQYAVGTRDFTIENPTRPLTATVWYPAQNPENLPEVTEYRLGILRYENGRAIRDASPLADDAPYPIVIFSHGSGGYRFQSTFLTEHLASYGFIVIAVDHPTNTIVDRLQRDKFLQNIPLNYAYRPMDVIQLMAFTAMLNAPGSDFAGLLDVENVAIMGHSFGGYTALISGGAQLNFDKLNQQCNATAQNPELLYNVCFIADFEAQIASLLGYTTPPTGTWERLAYPNVKAVIALAPWNAPILTIQNPYPPTLVIVGTADRTTPHERDAFPIYQMLPPHTSTYIEFANAGHYIFVDACFAQAIQFGFFSSCSDLVWDMQRAHDLINHFVTAFLMDKLKGDTDAYTVFTDQPPIGITISPENPPIEAIYPLTIQTTLAHDPSAYTQGLVFHQGLFYESTGLYGKSSLREVNPQTGEVLRQVNLDSRYFAEGLALVDDRLIQITWRENTAFVYDLATFDLIDTHTYSGEGWGLCYDGQWLYMSDGSNLITLRDSLTFEPIDTRYVTLNGQPIYKLNELECPEGEDFIIANVWQSDVIVMIDKTTGRVQAQLDGSALVNYKGEKYRNTDAVLNGIAYDPATATWYMTGKQWETMFIVTW